MQQSSATPKNRDVGRGLRKIVACSQSSSQCLLVSTFLGKVSSLHPTSFLMIFTLVSLIFAYLRHSRLASLVNECYSTSPIVLGGDVLLCAIPTWKVYQLSDKKGTIRKKRQGTRQGRKIMIHGPLIH